MAEPSRWDRLVDELVATREITSAAVEAAFRSAPRTRFLPGVEDEIACSDVPVPRKRQGPITLSGSSAPSMMAIMLERLEVRPGHRVLEVGAGTGYHAALLAELTGSAGSVHTIDLDEDITLQARVALDRAGYGHVQVVTGDGVLGFADGAPYDRIVLTVGCYDIAPAWIEQLAPDGVLMVPLWLRGVEVLTTLRRDGDGLVSDAVSPCMFQRLRGAHAGPEGPVALNGGTDLLISVDDRSAVDPATVVRQLRDAHRDIAVPVALDDKTLPHIGFWLALRRPDLCLLSLQGANDGGTAVPWGDRGSFRFAVGLLGRRGLALLGLQAGDGHAVFVRAFGEALDLGRALVHELGVWDADGRPATDAYRVRVYPPGAAKAPAAGQVRVAKPQSVIVVERA
jgi:protein-L-isoaspartate(D-aspartate) O-methyltransferase